MRLLGWGRASKRQGLAPRRAVSFTILSTWSPTWPGGLVRVGFLTQGFLPLSLASFFLPSFFSYVAFIYFSSDLENYTLKVGLYRRVPEGRRRGDLHVVTQQAFLRAGRDAGAPPQAGFSATLLSLPPWLGVKELTGQMGDTCFPCQLDDGGQTRVGRGPLSVGTDFCAQQQPGTSEPRVNALL